MQNKEEDESFNVPEQNLIFHKKKSIILVFILCANIMANITLLYPQGLQSYLEEEPYSLSSTEYGAFFSVSALPNIVLPFFFGIYLDKFNFNVKVILVLATITTLGAFFIAIGVYYVDYSLMIFGRFVFGLGNENINLLTKKMSLQTFTKKQMISTWGFYLFSKRVGSSIGSALPPYLYEYTQNMAITFSVQVIITLILGFFLLMTYYVMKNTNDLAHSFDYNSENGAFHWKEILANFISEADKVFWILISIIFLNFVMYCGFNSQMNNLLINLLNVEATEASNLIVFYDILLGIFQIFFAYVFSKTGYIIYEVIIGVILSIISFAFLLDPSNFETSLYLILIPLIILVLGYSLSANFVFSCLGLIVPAKYYGISYGLLQNCINVGILLGPIIFGALNDLSGGYSWPLYETIFLEILILNLAIFVCFLDYKERKVFCSKN